MTVDKWGISESESVNTLITHPKISTYPHYVKKGVVDLPDILVYTLETRESGESNQHTNKHRRMRFLAYPCVEHMCK